LSLLEFSSAKSPKKKAFGLVRPGSALYNCAVLANLLLEKPFLLVDIRSFEAKMALKMCFLSFRLNYIDGLWMPKGHSGESKPLFHGASLYTLVV
jgi:hypothetical protein